MQNKKGFSLLEVMCVLAILSFLALVSSGVIIQHAQTSQHKAILLEDVKNLSNALQEARLLAIQSGDSSYVCGGVDCQGNWSDGFVVMQPESYGGLYRRVTFEHDVSIVWQGFPANKSRITFLPNGLSGYQNGTFLFCYLGWHTRLVINQSGRFYGADVVATEDSDGACS
ncbi:GspH/FimT family protein [Marinomonas pollencensis]|uniref:Type II secretion system protein H n=1 Tax=Marinomonas pollencensis TaxID=491954 RepID=A0A3E0DN87_9GAMM|nr:GspH/FimT family pseudopilin [Marinomonas pollencensis]REG84290.1 type IV fimbrial biogenesis protein FimT [Marinomonas pollencensis]